ncbi:hypothetical protein M427DRAFT_173648 [Gonapodya prolifera JEL478]|uniref:Uncharacterized protein n=1 Tax=Gonapodya prolifera (strain JEL478) TaxID=1344416 RepID=A0A139B0G9_GONPJ|nr:hypothetical protein M427DRAFT_173648 [Gonapodya prolifera JEL478]|eukprot:KXS22491.1 hypothetical protein M427DRAFT_173648 [Gonapodya prolifera JEL478]
MLCSILEVDLTRELKTFANAPQLNWKQYDCDKLPKYTLAIIHSSLFADSPVRTLGELNPDSGVMDQLLEKRFYEDGASYADTSTRLPQPIAESFRRLIVEGLSRSRQILLLSNLLLPFEKDATGRIQASSVLPLADTYVAGNPEAILASFRAVLESWGLWGEGYCR